MSSPESRPAKDHSSDPTTITKVPPPPQPQTPQSQQPPPPLGALANQRMGQGSPRPPTLTNLPYMVQSPTGEVIPLALALGGVRGGDNLMMQGPPPPARQMDVRLPGMQGTSDCSSPVLEMQTPPPSQIPPPKGGNGVHHGMNGGGGGHLPPMPTSSSMMVPPRHQPPVMSMSDSSVGLVPNMCSSVGVTPTVAAMDLATHQMMHMTGGANNSTKSTTLPSPQYTPVDDTAGYNSNVVQQSGVHTVPHTGGPPVLSNSAVSMQLPVFSTSVTSMHMQPRTDNGGNHMMNAQQGGGGGQGMQMDHGRTLSYGAPPPTAVSQQSNFAVNPMHQHQQAPTAVTYVTTSSHHVHNVTLPPPPVNNTYQDNGATSMPFNNNQSATGYNNNPNNTSNNSALCTSCGCNGQCGDAPGHGPATPHFPPTFSGGAYLPNQLAFQQQNFNFFPPPQGGNVLPPAPTNNVMNSPMQSGANGGGGSGGGGGGTPAASPRYPSPMPPSPFQNMMPGEMPSPYGGNTAFHNLVPPAMYLGAMGLAAAAGQRTNHMLHGSSHHQLATQSKKSSAITCYNCGARGHRQIDCHEPTMESITHNSKF